jgi:hypothetical protein
MRKRCQPIIINIFLGEDCMPTTQFQVTLTINPGVTVVPVTLPAETVGVPVNAVPVGTAQGTGPFTVSTDPASPAQIPAGLTAAVDASGNVTLSGTPTTAETGTTFWLDAVSTS